MASSHIMNGKQRDRIASYAMNNNNSYRSNTIANKAATGNVAAGPSIQVNQQRRKKSYRARGCRGGASRKNSSRKKNLDSIDEENDSRVLNNNEIKHSANKPMSKSRRNKTRTLSILPKEEIKHLPPLRSDAADDSDKPILPSRDIRENPIAMNRTRTSNVQSVIARPSAHGKSNAGSQMGGFSFFSISPRSFLTGKKTSALFTS